MYTRLFYIALVLTIPALCAARPDAPSFHRDVLTILEKRCQECHRPGQVAPMPFLTYQQTRPWAKAIREAVLLKKMPPWFAEPVGAPFSNDRTLTREEVETLVSKAFSRGPTFGGSRDNPR